MKTIHSSIAGPFRHENLEIFILRGPETITHPRFIPLHEAMQAQTVTVHETGSVGQLEVENHGEEDLYIQAGDVVKGGRQDRTLGVDLVVRSGGGRIPIPSFCVEAQRWHRRRNESDKVFSASDTTLASKALRLSAKLSRDQGEVWDSVAHFQKTMSDNLAIKMQAAESPSSYQLSMEQDALKDRKRNYASALEPVLSDFPDAVGFAFAIHGKLNSADAYGSHDLFRRLWPRPVLNKEFVKTSFEPALLLPFTERIFDALRVFGPGKSPFENLRKTACLVQVRLIERGPFDNFIQQSPLRCGLRVEFQFGQEKARDTLLGRKHRRLLRRKGPSIPVNAAFAS